ncbi:MAG: DNA internalization-related competence protein ComEC/Rec2 [Firmicutes bacterium]|nr:DNA internalization-related competence protein ComEC/Rec2 [Bacillota bacterium]
MKRLKTILQSKRLYLILLVLLVFYVFCFTKILKYKSIYSDGFNEVQGKIIKYSLTDDKITFIIKAKEKISATYYFENIKKLNNIKIGSEVLVKGEMHEPSSNTIPNTFNYQKYLYNNKIYKTIKVDSIVALKKELSLFSKIKNFIYKKVENNEYLKLFIVGDKTSLDNNIYDSFKDCGVAHLLAVSGMHVSVLVAILNFLLKYISDNKRKVIISIFLFFYAYVVNFSPSILRVVFFFVFSFINKRLELKLNDIQILFWVAFILLIINPFFIYHLGFIYSFVTVFSLFLTRKYLKGKYLSDILVISFWALLFTLPITAGMNYEINLITFISNLILIPLVTFILYPLSLICFIFPALQFLLSSLTNLMEIIVSFISNVSFLTINIPKLSWFAIIIYYVLLLLIVYYNSKIYMGLTVFFVLIIKMFPFLNSGYQLYFLDVGQGDSTVLISPYQKEGIMIDTGGIDNYGKKTSYYISDNIILFLKSIGITKLKFLIVTHGDLDHIGNTEYLVENFKVEKVIFNCGEFNELEQKLIEVLDKKKIPYYSCIKELNIDDNKLYFLNNKDYGNENDNSSVIYTEHNNHRFLFMGDVGIEVEEDLIKKYNLQDIDVLKVGHHGSRTSSSKSFIDIIEPKYSIISVGKNNRYGHPNDIVLDNLEDSKIYRTDQDGSIMFKTKNNKLEIKTCVP